MIDFISYPFPDSRNVTRSLSDDTLLLVFGDHGMTKNGDHGGDSMDELVGPNHQIVLRDCLDLLLEDSESGKKYDYVVNDLTEFPVEKEVKGKGRKSIPGVKYW